MPLIGGSEQAQISLAAMPWALPDTPSIQLGLLTAALQEAGLRVRAHSLYLEAAGFFLNETRHLPPEERLTEAHYREVASRWWTVGLGDWIFLTRKDEAEEEAYCRYLRARDIPEVAIGRAKQMQALTPKFVELCVDEILASGARIVGFTSSFSQNIGSLAVARRLKERDQSLSIVFGGANCDGPMGPALHRQFPWVDFVVRGEGDVVFPKLCRELLQGGAITSFPGLCFRQNGETIAVPMASGPQAVMDTVPTPDYDEYFERLRKSPLRASVLPDVRLPIETSRGCWWGQKMHCTFCGLNGSTMNFRSKSPALVLSQVTALARKHHRVDFEVVDNILDMNYFHTLAPALAAARRQGQDFTFFFETKSNLRHHQVRLLRDAGILRIQPGIESLSSEILRIMRKGVSALQNIRLLKWATRYGIQVTWNIIYGFPGEPVEEYARMADLVPSLMHLKPPGGLVPLGLQRFSPYHDAPESWGLEITGPAAYYPHLYTSRPDLLRDLAYEFEYRHADGRDPETYAAPLRAAIEKWDHSYQRGGRNSLRYWRGPDFLRIRDERPGRPPRDYMLGETEAEIYLRCDAGATPAQVAKTLPLLEEDKFVDAAIEEFLRELVAARLVYEERGRYLSLAIPANADADCTPWEMASEVALIPVEMAH